MTFDPNQPYKNVDGVNINLTAQEITDLAAEQAAYAAAIAALPPPIPDLATQLAAVLINNGTIAATDINATTLTAVNTMLTAAGQTAIAVTSAPVSIATTAAP